MKTIKFIILVAIFSGLMFACNQESSGKKGPKRVVENMTQKESGKDLISQDTFDVWKERWNMDYKQYMANDSMFYFDMPLVDLKDILEESNATTARFYLGMAMDTLNITGKDTILKLPHLMLVGVNNGVVNTDVIADYSKVCPPLCSN